MSFKRVLFITTLLFLAACSKKENRVQETLLAKVGDRTISVNEFIRRAEYTIRPVWCRGDDYIQRKIVLNSLIAEKMLALEASDSTEMLNNPGVRAFLRGRREQAMRQIHFTKTAVEKVALDSRILQKAYGNAQRKYNLNVIPLNKELAVRIGKDLEEGTITFDALLDEFEAAIKRKNKTQEFSFSTPMDDALFKALFLNEVPRGQVIGPMKVGTDSFVLMRVEGWTKSLIMGESKSRMMEKDIRERLTQVLARDIYAEWVAGLMADKQMTFNPSVFEELVNIVGPEYFKSNKEREEAFNKRFWKTDKGEMYLEDTRGRLEKILDQPFLTVDGETWTVRRFEQEVKVHPLVFRNRRMPKKNFSAEFRLAVADLIRDKYITAAAYEEGYDSNPLVKRNENMWRDNLLALYQRRKILRGFKSPKASGYSLVEKYLDPYMEKLREKYQKQVLINTDAFENIKLTSVNMFVIQRNMPFPVPVPEFPQLTTHNKLDYGRKMEGNIDEK